MNKYLHFFLLFFMLGVAHADMKPLIETFDFQCDSNFPCSTDLKIRTLFWMNVYGRWDNQAVFHDPDEPARVYAVLEPGSRCPMRNEDESENVKNKRDEIKSLILSVAEKRDQSNPNYTRDEIYIRDLFSGADTEEMEDSAASIRCQQGIKTNFMAGLKRYGALRDYVVRTLQEADMPEDFQYLPFVESSYDPSVYSRVGAAGLWQLMPRTARLRGLKVNGDIDERLDPYQSTKVAVGFLEKSLYPIISKAILNEMTEAGEMFPGPFVLTSYNYGPAGMSRAIRHIGPDYEKVIENYKARKFGNAVKNFYPSFLAARELASHANKYFGPIQYDTPLAFDEVTLPVFASPQKISNTFNVTLDEIKELNPAITRKVWDAMGKKERRVIPKGFTLKLPKSGTSWEPMLAALVSKPTETFTYIIQPGDTLSRIAQKLRVPESTLWATNSDQLGESKTVKIGQKLMIPGGKL